MAPKHKKPISAKRTEQKPASFIAAHELRIVLALCILAGLRVLIFGAAFPFFNNVDEGAHFDLICKYAMGHVPTHIEHYSSEAANRIIYTFTSEYDAPTPGASPGSTTPPLWTSASKYEVERTLEESVPHVKQKTNHESTQPPLYYILAGGWFRLGKLLHLDGGHLIYWLKLIDVLAYMPLVWLSYLFARRFFGRDDFMRLGVPLLLVVFPQDTFYSLNNDVLTPLLFGLAFYCLLDLYLAESKNYRFHVLTGLAVALTFMNKFTNLPILIIFGAVLVLKFLKSQNAGKLGADVPKLAAAFLAAVAPITALLIRNRLVLGDFAGAAAKIERMGWTVKPLGQVWQHPIFTPSGMIYFWNALMKTYWRGEFIWSGNVLASNGVDLFYVLSTTALVAACIVSLRMARNMPSGERLATTMGLWVFGISIAMIGLLSTLYDYGWCFYPSRALPYLTSGRLLSGTMIPFAALYIYGLNFVLSRIGLARHRWGILFIILSVILISELSLTAPVFGSLYNWYHML